ncbi:MAG: hypothetical protein FJ095_05685 [Deltaproteobacteria bacterium]|nr:hypothetical protein [Deltaproteobacteria bacterium]
MRAAFAMNQGLSTVVWAAALVALGAACEESGSSSSAAPSVAAAGSGGAAGTTTSASASTAVASSSTAVQSSSAATSGAGGGNVVCDPPAAADSVFATSETKVGDVKPTSMCEYRGKVLLIFNAAELCGYTGQSTALQKLEASYEGKGLEVLGFYSNDFGNQGGDPAACNANYKISFDTFDIAPVKGANARPVFAWLAKQSNPGPEATLEPQWNFSKYLIGRDGKLVKHWSHAVVPDDKQITAAIEAELAKK